MGLSLKIGTRSSPLALWQAEWVKGELLALERVDTVELVKIKTSGDKILDVPLAKVGGKGLFTKEIEESLLRNETDLAVHSLKDVPTEIPDGLKVEVITERENPLDVVIGAKGPIMELPKGARIGTSSLRRSCQLKRLRPDFEIVQIRGNVGTRMKKIETDNLAAVILAAAGALRMGFEDKITEYLPTAVSLPAVGQGALAIETRTNDPDIEAVVATLHHRPTALCVMAERAFLRTLEGGCQVPIGCHGTIEDDTLTLEGLVADLDGIRYFRETVTGNPDDGERLGVTLAESLLSAGADKVLAEFYNP